MFRQALLPMRKIDSLCRLSRSIVIVGARSNQANPNIESSTEDESSGKGFKKNLLLGVGGLGLLGFLITASTQLPLDPDRITPGKSVFAISIFMKLC